MQIFFFPFTSSLPFYKINSTTTTKETCKKKNFVGNESFPGFRWSQEACLIKKNKRKTLSVRSSCTAEDNRGRKLDIFLPPPYHLQHKHTQTLTKHLSFYFSHPLLFILLHPFCNVVSPLWLTERTDRKKRRVQLLVALFVSVFWLPSTSTQRCHSVSLSTLPVRPRVNSCCTPHTN